MKVPILEPGTTFESLVAEAHSLGLKVNNCFELPSGWQANFRPRADGSDDDLMVFGRGPTAVDALKSALDLVRKVLQSKDRKAEKRQPVQIDIEEAIASRNATQVPDIEDLL